MASERWQYNVVELKISGWTMKVGGDQLQSELNKLGAQGWELVTIRQVTTSLQLVMKRQA